MRLTCLKCGHQVDLTLASAPGQACICGQSYELPAFVDTGVRPHAQAAERSRSRAFRAAGLVQNIGGFALGISLLGILFFPLGLVGAALGLYVMTMVRGPLRRYSGRGQAAWAVSLGVAVFLGEGGMMLSWWQQQRLTRLAEVQQTAAEDLGALRRAERLYRATEQTYGRFADFHFVPRYGQYTLYLGADDFTAAHRGEQQVVDPLPPELVAAVSRDAFTAVAVANLDDDADLDVWVMSDAGTIEHVKSDVPP